MKIQSRKGWIVWNSENIGIAFYCLQINWIAFWAMLWSWSLLFLLFWAVIGFCGKEWDGLGGSVTSDLEKFNLERRLKVVWTVGNRLKPFETDLNHLESTLNLLKLVGPVWKFEPFETSENFYRKFSLQTPVLEKIIWKTHDITDKFPLKYQIIFSAFFSRHIFLLHHTHKAEQQHIRIKWNSWWNMDLFKHNFQES